MALIAGGPAEARRAAARLDMLVDPFEPAFAAALGRLRARHGAAGGQPFVGGTGPHDLGTASVGEELAAERRSPAGHVARALI